MAAMGEEALVGADMVVGAVVWSLVEEAASVLVTASEGSVASIRPIGMHHPCKALS